jgi:hypothetical protein
MMDIFGYQEYGFFLRDMDIYGHHPGGDMKQAFMAFMPDTGVLTSDTMEAFITVTDIMEQDSLVEDGKEIISDTTLLL